MKRQAQYELGAGAALVDEQQFAAQPLRDPAADGEAEAGAATARRLAAREFGEDTLAVAGRDARTIVGDADLVMRAVRAARACPRPARCLRPTPRR